MQLRSNRAGLLVTPIAEDRVVIGGQVLINLLRLVEMLWLVVMAKRGPRYSTVRY